MVPALIFYFCNKLPDKSTVFLLLTSKSLNMTESLEQSRSLEAAFK